MSIHVGQDQRRVAKVYLGARLISRMYHMGKLVFSGITRVRKILFGDPISDERVFVDALSASPEYSIAEANLHIRGDDVSLEGNLGAAYSLPGSQASETGAHNFTMPGDSVAGNTFRLAGHAIEDNKLLLISGNAIAKLTPDTGTGQTIEETDTFGSGNELDISNNVRALETVSNIYIVEQTGQQGSVNMYIFDKSTKTLGSKISVPAIVTGQLVGVELFGNKVGICHYGGIYMYRLDGTRLASEDISSGATVTALNGARHCGAGYILKPSGNSAVLRDYENNALESLIPVTHGGLGAGEPTIITRDGLNAYAVFSVGAATAWKIPLIWTGDAQSNRVVETYEPEGVWVDPDDSTTGTAILYSKKNVTIDGVLRKEYRFYKARIVTPDDITLTFIDGGGALTSSTDDRTFVHLVDTENFIYGTDAVGTVTKFDKATREFDTRTEFTSRGNVLFKMENVLAHAETSTGPSTVTGNHGAVYRLAGSIAQEGGSAAITFTDDYRPIGPAMDEKGVLLVKYNGVRKIAADRTITQLITLTGIPTTTVVDAALETEDVVYTVTNSGVDTEIKYLNAYNKSDNSRVFQTDMFTISESGVSVIGMDVFGELIGVVTNTGILMFNATDGTRVASSDVTANYRTKSAGNVNAGAGFFATNELGGSVSLFNYDDTRLASFAFFSVGFRKYINAKIFSRDGTILYGSSNGTTWERASTTWTGEVQTNVVGGDTSTHMRIYDFDLNKQTHLDFEYTPPAGVSHTVGKYDFYIRGYFFIANSVRGDYNVFRHDYTAGSSEDTPQGFVHSIDYTPANRTEQLPRPGATNSLTDMFSTNGESEAFESRTITKLKPPPFMYPTPMLRGTMATAGTANAVTLSGTPVGTALDASSILVANTRGNLSSVAADGTLTGLTNDRLNRFTVLAAMETTDNYYRYAANAIYIINKTTGVFSNTSTFSLPTGATLLGMDQFGGDIGIVHTKGIMVFEADGTRKESDDVEREYTGTYAGGGVIVDSSFSTGVFSISDYEGNRLFGPTANTFFSQFLNVDAISRDGTIVYGRNSFRQLRKSVLTWTRTPEYPSPALAGDTITASDSQGITFADNYAPIGPALDAKGILLASTAGVRRLNAGNSTDQLVTFVNALSTRFDKALEDATDIYGYTEGSNTLVRVRKSTGAILYTNSSATVPSGATVLGIDKFGPGNLIGVVHSKGITMFNDDCTRSEIYDVTRDFGTTREAAKRAGAGMYIANSGGAFQYRDYENRVLVTADQSIGTQGGADALLYSSDGTQMLTHDGTNWFKWTITWT